MNNLENTLPNPDVQNTSPNPDGKIISSDSEEQLRHFAALSLAKKIRILLLIADEPIPKAGILKWAELDYDNLSKEDKEEVDSVFEEVEFTMYENERRYLPSLEKRNEFTSNNANLLDAMSAYRQVVTIIGAQIANARKQG